MNANNYHQEDTSFAEGSSTKKSYRFSFSSFHKAIKANNEIRKQVDDIIDFGLFDYALRCNTSFIQAVYQKAEKESVDLLMRFANGASEYRLLKNKIHRNRIIRALALKDNKEHLELINKLTC
jgi:hypothetical protein